jgi:hypothetical protein
MMEIRKHIAIITALSLCGSGLHGMQSMKNVRGLYYPTLIGLGICGAVYLGSRLYTRLNTYSIKYNTSNESGNEVIFDNIKLTKGRDEFSFSGTIWEYNTHETEVGHVIREQLVNHVAPLLKKGKSVIVKLNDQKTAHFSGKSHTDEEIMHCILEVLLTIDFEKHIQSFKVSTL